MAHASVTSRIEHKKLLPPFHEQEAPWWDLLDRNFHEQSESFSMPWSDRIQVAGTAAVDRVMNTLFSTMLSATILPTSYRPGRLDKWIEESKCYLEAAATGDASVFFRPPPRSVPVRHKPARRVFFRPKDGICEALSFRSPYQCYVEGHRPQFEKFKRNKTARAMYWRHKDKPRPTIIGVHGFSADPFALNQIFFALPWFFAMGCDVALYTMPFHGARAPLGSGYSGRHFFAGGPSHINESMGQTICDLQALVQHLHEEVGAPQTAFTGISLGGLASSLMACVEPRLTCVIPNVPVVSLGDLLLEWHPISEILQALMKRAGLDTIELRKAFAAISPISYRPLLPKENLMIIAGAADRMAPPKQSRLLNDHWDQCNIHWFPGNHTLHLDRGNYLREMGRFLNRVGFLEDDRLPEMSRWRGPFGRWKKSA